jgi:hypothetical protein
MKKFLLLLTFFLCIKSASSQTQLDEVVYLKNGSVIRGTIIEQVPNVKLKIQTHDGNIFVYNFDEIEKITKEPSTLSNGINNNFNNNFNPRTTSYEIDRHRTKGIALTVTGVTVFAVGFPIMLVVEIISGTILTAASIPMIIIGPIQLAKYKRLKRAEGLNSGLFLRPTIEKHNLNGLNSNVTSVGATLQFNF